LLCAATRVVGRQGGRRLSDDTAKPKHCMRMVENLKLTVVPPAAHHSYQVLIAVAQSDTYVDGHIGRDSGGEDR
jgi:hypothetical protein